MELLTEEQKTFLEFGVLTHGDSYGLDCAMELSLNKLNEIELIDDRK